jgi:uncharacterized secreted protein with C-terminal beta-propeller domain
MLTFILSGCSFSFPWEEDRLANIEVDLNPNISENDQKEVDAETENAFSSKGELRKFTSLDSVKDLINLSPALSSDLDNLSLFSSYTAVSNVDIKNLVNSSVITNIPDSVQIKGEYAYLLNKEKLQVVSLDVENTSLVSEVSFSYRPLEMLVAGDNLLVSGYQGDNSFLRIFDISNPLNPRETRFLQFVGDYKGFRADDDYVYFLTTSPVDYKDTTKLLPDVLSGGVKLGSKCVLNNECLPTQVYYFNQSYDNYGFLSVATINLDVTMGAINRQLYLLDDNYRLYFSEENNLYLTYEDYWSRQNLETIVKKDLFFNDLSDGDRVLVAQNENDLVKISSIFDAHLNSLEDDAKSSAQVDINSALKIKIKKMSSDLEKVRIYKFVSNSGRLSYNAQGEVDGRFLEGNFLDEEDGYLRLVTKRGELWPLLFSGEPKEYSNVYTLDSSLNIVGSLENVATSASINETYFMSSRSYLFTSQDSDPIYVIDFNVKEKPAILGALQISKYNHFYPASQLGDKLIAIGKQEVSDNNSENQLDSVSSALKLSLFDFSDLKKPSELSSYVIGDSSSESIALTDYKSLANILDSKTIVMPASFKDQGVLSFSGALVFSFNDEGKLNLLHRIDHSAGGLFSDSDPWNNFDYYDNTVRRSFISDNNLVTISNKYLKVNNLVDGSELASVILFASPEDEVVAERNQVEIIEEMETDEANGFLPEEEEPIVEDITAQLTPEEEIVGEEGMAGDNLARCEAMCLGEIEREEGIFCTVDDMILTLDQFCGVYY